MRFLTPALIVVAMAMCTRSYGITYSDFVTSGQLSAGLSNTATIGFTYAGNKFVGSVYYGPNNNQLYSVNLTGGSLATFGSPIPGFSGEVYVNASLGLGGFGNRDIFAGCSDVSGVIYRIANDASSQGTFVTSGILGVRAKYWFRSLRALHKQHDRRDGTRQCLYRRQQRHADTARRLWARTPKASVSHPRRLVPILKARSLQPPKAAEQFARSRRAAWSRT